MTLQLDTVPYGWHHDESVKGIMAREVLEGKGFPIFFPAYTGREPLYIYLSAGAMAAFGEGIFAVRLNSVFLGTLTLAVAFALSRAMFGTRVALYASAFLAVSLWYVIASRNGYRAVSQPLFEALALWLLWRGLQSQRRRDFLLGGAALGLVLYTYTAGRVFPAMLVLFFALQLLTNWRWARGQIRGMGLFLACGAAVAVPLALYFWVHPADFFGRAGQVSVFNPAFSQGDPLGRLWQSILETLGMFSQRGDPNWRFNLSNRPVFDPLSAALFYFGLALCLVRAVRSKGLERAAYTLLPLWLLVMLIPAMLTAEDVPASQRAIGIIPAVYILPALGLAWLSQRFSGWSFALVAGIFFAILGGVTYRDYFVAWAQAPAAYQERQAEMVDVAQYLKQSSWDGRFFIAADYPQHPTVAFLAPEQYDRSYWFDARQAIALPPDGVGAVYLFTDRSPPAPRLLDRLSLQHLDDVRDRWGRIVFSAWLFDGSVRPKPPRGEPVWWSPEIDFPPGDPRSLRKPLSLPVNFGGEIAFLGYDRTADTLSPGQPVDVVLYWRLLGRPEQEYSIFVHLLSAEGKVIGEADANRYPSASWEPGEMLLSYYQLAANPQVASGEAQMEIGVYHQPSGQRLPILVDSAAVADRLLLEPVAIR